MNIGFIGTGNMGNPMARNLVKVGHQLTVHDLKREAAVNLLEMGATWVTHQGKPSRAMKWSSPVYPPPGTWRQ